MLEATYGRSPEVDFLQTISGHDIIPATDVVIYDMAVLRTNGVCGCRRERSATAVYGLFSGVEKNGSEIAEGEVAYVLSGTPLQLQKFRDMVTEVRNELARPTKS